MAAVQELVAKGCDLTVAQASVARAEQKRLELAAAARATPMEAVSVDDLPSGAQVGDTSTSGGEKRKKTRVR